MLCKRSKEPNETLRIFKNVIVDFSCFFLFVLKLMSTNPLGKHSKIFREEVGFKAQISLRSSILRLKQ